MTVVPCGDVESITLLVEAYGLDVTKRGKYNWNALSFAVSYDQPLCVRKLVKWGAVPTAHEMFRVITFCERPDLLKLFCESGGDVEAEQSTVPLLH